MSLDTPPGGPVPDTPPLPPPGSSPPARVGPHQVVTRLGQGGMGDVLLVRDDALDREVAAKILRPGDAQDAEQRRRAEAFVREARLTGKLDHPGIVPVHALGRADDGRPFFTMKRVEGETLAAAAPAWSLARRLEAFLKVCDALAFAHDKGVIHRDLKPANVMVGRFGEVVVLDWGLARPTSDGALGDSSPDAPTLPVEGEALTPTEVVRLGTARGAIAGTPAYMAPEQARGDVVDARADVFGLGAILYELLTGQAPWTAATPEASLARALRYDLRPPRELAPEVPWELEAAALRALARRPEERYPDAQALRADVVSFLEGRLMSAARYGPLQRLARWARPRRGQLLGGAAAALALALGLGLVVRARLERAAFERDAQAARVASAAGRHAEARLAAARALARFDDPGLQAIAAESQAALDQLAADEARAADQAARYRRVQEAVRPVARLIDEVRPLRHVAHVDLRARLVEVEAALVGLQALLREPGMSDFAEPWALLGAGWSLCGRAGRARAALRQAHQLAPEDGAVRIDLGRLELEHLVVPALAFADVSRPDRPTQPDLSQVAKGAAAALELLDSGAVAGRTGAALDAARILALVAFARGDRAAMRAACEEGLARDAGELEVADLWVLLALAAGPGGGDAFQAPLDRALALRPHDPWARTLRALSRAWAHDAAGARRDLDRVLGVYPHHGLAALSRGALRAAANDAVGALQDLEVAVEELPDLSVAWLDRGLLRARLGKTDGALEDLARAAALGGGGQASVTAERALVHVALQAGRLVEARAAARRGLRLLPDDLALGDRMAVARADDDPQAALAEAIDEALALRPGWPLALVQRAGLLSARGDQAAARAALQQALSAEALTALDHVARATALEGLGRTGEARSALDVALGLDPTNRQALGMRGLSRASRGDADGALLDLEAAARVGDLTADEALTAARLRLARRDGPQAAAHARAAAAAAPDDPAAQLALGEALVLTRDFEGARGAFARATNLDAGSSTAWINLGAALLATNDPTGARTALERGVTLAPSDWRAWRNLGLACGTSGDPAAARVALARATELAPSAEARAGIESLVRGLDADETPITDEPAESTEAMPPEPTTEPPGTEAPPPTPPEAPR